MFAIEIDIPNNTKNSVLTINELSAIRILKSSKISSKTLLFIHLFSGPLKKIS